MRYINSSIFKVFLLTAPLFAQAELSAMDDTDMQSVSGKGIEIDANVDFVRDTVNTYDVTHDQAVHDLPGYTAAGLGSVYPNGESHSVSEYDDWSFSATDDTYIAYRQVIVDEFGNRLEDIGDGVGGLGDGYLNVFNSTENVKKEDTLNGYNVVYKNPQEGDYLIRKPAYIIMGEISGGISFTGLKFDFVSNFGYDNSKPLTDENSPRPAMKWTLPSQINFKNFEVSGLYVSTDEFIDRADNKLLGLRIDGPIYLPSATAAYVFVTSD
jgi:hypothetical protein